MNDTSNERYLDLLAQRDALDKQIEEVAAVARLGVIETIKAQMALYQIAPKNLIPAHGTRKRLGPVAAKYRDPNTGGDLEWPRPCAVMDGRTRAQEVRDPAIGHLGRRATAKAANKIQFSRSE